MDSAVLALQILNEKIIKNNKAANKEIKDAG